MLTWAEAITTEGSKVVPEQPAKAQGVLAVEAETQLILNPSPGTRYTHRAALPQCEVFITGDGDNHCSQQSALHMSGPQGDQETGGTFVTGAAQAPPAILVLDWPLTNTHYYISTVFKEQPFPGIPGYVVIVRVLLAGVMAGSEWG